MSTLKIAFRSFPGKRECVCWRTSRSEACNYHQAGRSGSALRLCLSRHDCHSSDGWIPHRGAAKCVSRSRSRADLDNRRFWHASQLRPSHDLRMGRLPDLAVRTSSAHTAPQTWPLLASKLVRPEPATSVSPARFYCLLLWVSEGSKKRRFSLLWG